MGAGTVGVPRRHWDISFSDATAGAVYEFPGAANTMLALNGVFVVLAVLGGAAFCVIVVSSLLFGKKLGEDEKVSVPMIAEAPSDADYVGIGRGSISVPGTLVFALVFFASFAIYYFVNWKFLGETWGIS